MASPYALCLVCRKPNKKWLDFLYKFKHYDIYILIDDNLSNYNGMYGSLYKTINFIQIDDKKCIEANYTDITFSFCKKVTSWEKSIYYFSIVNTRYENIWFIEEDVFFFDEATLLAIDNKYINSDFLCSGCDQKQSMNEWHWDRIRIHLPQPHYNAMICANRMSSRLLQAIKNYSLKNKELFFLEALFPSITKANNLIYDCPAELKSIKYRTIWDSKSVNKFNLYHPIKDLEKHSEYRVKLSKRE